MIMMKLIHYLAELVQINVVENRPGRAGVIIFAIILGIAVQMFVLTVPHLISAHLNQHQLEKGNVI